MNPVLDHCPILGLDDGFPERVWLIHHIPTNRYGCFHFQGVDGLASFSEETTAERFSFHINLSPLDLYTQEVSFEEAREIAKARPMPVTALMLVDDLSHPLIHYVK